MTTLQIENAILDIVDNAGDMTRSDLQGCVEALARRITPSIMDKKNITAIIREVAVRTETLVNDGKMTFDEVSEEINSMADQAAIDIFEKHQPIKDSTLNRMADIATPDQV
jgi:folate-dependent tRNA-U54 methylase TrmFO/GidA